MRWICGFYWILNHILFSLNYLEFRWITWIKLNALYSADRPMLFQTAEHIAKSVAVGDVVTYSLVLQFLFSRAYPGLKPPYQVSAHFSIFSCYHLLAGHSCVITCSVYYFTCYQYIQLLSPIFSTFICYHLLSVHSSDITCCQDIHLLSPLIKTFICYHLLSGRSSVITCYLYIHLLSVHSFVISTFTCYQYIHLLSPVICTFIWMYR